jgi:hypothetical protein
MGHGLEPGERVHHQVENIHHHERSVGPLEVGSRTTPRAVKWPMLRDANASQTATQIPTQDPKGTLGIRAHLWQLAP